MAAWKDTAAQESVFNQALQYLEQQVTDILKECQRTAMIQDVQGWLTCLYALDRSLSVKTSDEEDEMLMKDLNDIASYFTNQQNISRNKTIVLSKLHTLDKKMRRMAQKKGMLLASRDDPRFAVLKR